MDLPEHDAPTQRYTRSVTLTHSPGFQSRYDFEVESRLVVVALTGNLDSGAVEGLHPQIQELVRAGYRRFVIDMMGLEYLGSLGLRLIVGLANQLKADGAVALCNATAGVRSVIELTKVDQVLKTHATREKATLAVRNACV
jgi:anti-anti-sigma factor